MKFVCAKCGAEIEKDEVVMVLDNFLQVKYFDDNKSNRFCSKECACDALSIETMYDEDVPLDEGENEDDD